MIIVASQRGHAKELARHLLNTLDNDTVEVHRVQGFMAQDITGALEESHLFSQGTRCRQHLFSVSFNPPPQKDVTTAQLRMRLPNAPKQWDYKTSLM